MWPFKKKKKIIVIFKLYKPRYYGLCGAEVSTWRVETSNSILCCLAFEGGYKISGFEYPK